MKLLEQKQLHFQNNSSDKIYEVDLCEVGIDEYLVNFRYGRRGGNLKEGTKTSFPVSREKADKLFNKLVDDKLKKGYVDVSVSSLKEQTDKILEDKDLITKGLSPEEARKAHILNHLTLATKSLDLQASKNWDIKRVVWRAGELKIKEATPLLIQLGLKSKRGKSKQELYQYCILWALGKTAPNTDWIAETLDFIDSIIKNGKSSSMLQRIALEAYRAIAQNNILEKFLDAQLAKLDANLQDAIQKDNYYSCLKALNKIKDNFKQHWQLERAYLLIHRSTQLKKALFELLSNMSIQVNYFRTLRHFYKLAEFRQDGQFYGLLAYKIEKQAALFKMPAGEDPSMYHQYSWIKPKVELKKEDSKIAFSEGTKKYLNKRTRRTLTQLGNSNDRNYVLLATGILLQYDDATDGKTARVSKDWTYDKQKCRWRSKISYFDTYSKEFLFNELLFANSSRFEYSKKQNEWICTNGYQPSDQMATPVREEAYPDLWDQVPQAFVHLLVESNSEKVSNFALRGLKAHQNYVQIINRFDVPLVIKLLEKPFKAANFFALDLAKRLYRSDQPNYELVISLLKHSRSTIREQALAWIEASYFTFFVNTDFVRILLTHEASQIRNWATLQLHKILDLYDASKRKALNGCLIGYCLRQAKDTNIIEEIHSLLSKYFEPELKQLSLDVVARFLQHTQLKNQEFAAQLLENHSIDTDRIPIDYVVQLIHHKVSHLSQKGLLFLERYSNITLVKQKDLLFKLSISKASPIRIALKSIIVRLANQYNNFAEDVSIRYVRLLLRKESYEGVHQYIYQVLTEDLAQWLTLVDRKLIFRLLNSDHAKAQELACMLIDKYIPFESMSVQNIIRLADHEIRAARVLAWKMFSTQIPRIKYEREEAIRLMDAKWEDSREFAFNFFKNEFQDKDWTPELLIGICDSVRPDVQSFGRNLIARFFKEEDGVTYLLKLSQHPRPELQLFATNYLSRYASDNLLHIKKLRIYFVTVLTQVNKARVAKDRIIQFLYQEALKSYEVAQEVSEILSFVSATSAIGDKAQYIEMMRDLKVKYPVLDLPISLQPTSQYSK